MENNNGSGIFYGVIGVATLVVAIIGATFAYFSATVTGTGNVTAGTTNITLGWGGNVDTGLKNDLIPIDTDIAGKKWTDQTTAVDQAADDKDYDVAFARAVGIGANQCKDNEGNSICSVYQFTITNPNETTAQTVYGHLNVEATTELTDLYYAVFVGEAADLVYDTSKQQTTGFNVHGTASTAETLMVNEDSKGGLIHGATLATSLAVGTVNDTEATKWTRIPGATKLLQPTESITYTIVLWLEESYTDQDTQEGKTFAANIMFNTGSGSGVTGILNVVA